MSFSTQISLDAAEKHRCLRCSIFMKNYKEINDIVLTIVLDDAFEVISHQVLQGTLVGQTKAVRKHDGRVYNRAVDELQSREESTHAVTS